MKIIIPQPVRGLLTLLRAGRVRYQLIPHASRNPSWLATAAADLWAAAGQHEPRFEVSGIEIHDKLFMAPKLAVATLKRRVVGFVSATEIVRLSRTGLSARYIEGTIVSPKLQGKGTFSRLLAALGPRADVEILHTQNPAMMRALIRGRWRSSFPDPDWESRVKAGLVEDLWELLTRHGRKPDFCPVTGVVSANYGKCLYGSWPLPNKAKAKSFLHLEPTSAILVLSFASEQAARVGLAANSQSEVA